MSKFAARNIQRQRGQGMTEYIIIVALIAVAAIGIYQAFGKVVRTQTGVAAAALAGGSTSGARGQTSQATQDVNTQVQKTSKLNNFEQ